MTKQKPQYTSIKSIIFGVLTSDFQTITEIHNAVKADYPMITAYQVIMTITNLCKNGSCIREDPTRRKWQRYKKAGAP